MTRLRDELAALLAAGDPPDLGRAALTIARIGYPELEAEPYLAMVHIAGMPKPGDWGFDAAVEFPPHSMEADVLTEHVDKLNPDFVGDVWDYISAARFAIARPVPDFRRSTGTPPASPGAPPVGWRASEPRSRAST